MTFETPPRECRTSLSPGPVTDLVAGTGVSGGDPGLTEGLDFVTQAYPARLPGALEKPCED